MRYAVQTKVPILESKKGIDELRVEHEASGSAYVAKHDRFVVANMGIKTATLQPLMSTQPPNVFIDANVLAQVGPPPGNATFQRLVDLVDYRLINAITTDVSKSELARLHVATANKKMQPITDAEFQRLMRTLFGVQIPSVNSQEIVDKIRANIGQGVEVMFSALKARVASVADVNPTVIFADYDREEGLFHSKNKRNQFSDAFIFECLKTVANEGPPMLVVTNDGDFDRPVSDEPNMILINSIPNLFNWLGLRIEEPEVDLIEFLNENLEANGGVLEELEQDDWELDEGRYLDLRLRNFEGIYYTAFQQIRPGAPLLVSVEATAYLDGIDSSSSDNQVETTARAQIAFHAAVEVDEQGIPVNLTDVRFFEYTMHLDNATIWFLYD